MAILVYFKADNPNNVSEFPPTVSASDWCENLTNYILSKIGSYNNINTHFTVDNMDELNNFLRDYTLTDATLLNDLAVWKAAHSITHIGGFYDLSPGGGLLAVNHILPVDTVAVDPSLI